MNMSSSFAFRVEHGPKTFRRGESPPANSAVREDNHRFVDSGRGFLLNWR